MRDLGLTGTYIKHSDGECTTDRVYLFSSNIAPQMLQLVPLAMFLHYKKRYIDLQGAMDGAT